jgi:hypothetical protein
MQMDRLAHQLFDLHVRDAPIVHRFRERLPPVEASIEADQPVDVAGMVVAREQAAPRRVEIGGRVRHRLLRGLVAARDLDIGEEGAEVRVAFRMRIAVEVEHRHLLRLRVAAFADGIGAGLVDELDRLPARGQRQKQQHREHEGDYREALGLRALAGIARPRQHVAKECPHAPLLPRRTLFRCGLMASRQFESKLPFS